MKKLLFIILLITTVKSYSSVVFSLAATKIIVYGTNITVPVNSHLILAFNAFNTQEHIFDDSNDSILINFNQCQGFTSAVELDEKHWHDLQTTLAQIMVHPQAAYILSVILLTH